MITAAEQVPSLQEVSERQRFQLVDANSDFRFGVDPEQLNPDSQDFGVLHDVEFVVINSNSREIAVKKLRRFIHLLEKYGFDVSEEE